MERIFRGIIQVGSQPDMEDCTSNWIKLLEHELEFKTIEDKSIFTYLRTFYEQMSAPPDFGIIKEYFEKQDSVEVVARLEEIKKAQVHIRTNYLAILRAELDQQQVRGITLLCRDASAIAEHGKNLEKPVNGKKILRGPVDAVNFLFENLSHFTKVENGEKLEGLVSEDAGELLDEYEVISKTNKYAGRNLFGLEPVDSVCQGHKNGEYWIHCAFVGELKCLAGSSTVFDHKTKKRRTMKELHESGDRPIVSALYKEGEKFNFVPAQASKIVKNGVRKTYEIRLESGRRTRSTDNHPFYSINGWKELKNLKHGDWIAVPKETRVSDPDRSFTDEEVKVIGYLLGDGYVDNNITLTASNIEIRRDFMDCLKEMGMIEGYADFKTANFIESLQTNRAPGVRVSSSPGDLCHRQISPVRTLLDELKIHGKVAATKRIPHELFGISDHQVALLIGALWSTDGSIHVGEHTRLDRPCGVSSRNDIKCYSISEGLCMDIQSLLLRLGINSTVTNYQIEYNGLPHEVYVTRVVTSKSKSIFCDLIRPVGKDHGLDWAMERINTLDDTPLPSCLIPTGTWSRTENGTKHHASQLYQTVAQFVAEGFRGKDKLLDKTLDGEIRWERIESVEFVKEEMTYDMEVPAHHSFVVDDIVCHNTSVALNYAYNNAMIYGKNIFYSILEMPYKQLRRQIYVLHSSHGKFMTEWHREDIKNGLKEPYQGLDYRKVRDGELNVLDRKRLEIVARDFESTCKGKLYIWRPADEVGISDIRRKAEMFHNKYGCDGIIIDNLSNVKPRYRSSDTVTSINSVVRDGRMMALSFARGKTVPVLGLFHLNRQGKIRADKNDGRYDFAAISYANEIEKSADVVTYSYLNDQLRKEGKFYVGCLKNRDNPLFDRMVGKIFWNTKRMRAMELGMLDIDNDRLLMEAQVREQFPQLAVSDMM